MVGTLDIQVLECFQVKSSGKVGAIWWSCSVAYIRLIHMWYILCDIWHGLYPAVHVFQSSISHTCILLYDFVISYDILCTYCILYTFESNQDQSCPFPSSPSFLNTIRPQGKGIWLENRSTPHPVTVTTIVVGNPYKPSFATGWGVDPRYIFFGSFLPTGPNLTPWLRQLIVQRQQAFCERQAGWSWSQKCIRSGGPEIKIFLGICAIKDDGDDVDGWFGPL